jgi:hypothetical protein
LLLPKQSNAQPRASRAADRRVALQSSVDGIVTCLMSLATKVSVATIKPIIPRKPRGQRPGVVLHLMARASLVMIAAFIPARS